MMVLRSVKLPLVASSKTWLPQPCLCIHFLNYSMNPPHKRVIPQLIQYHWQRGMSLCHQLCDIKKALGFSSSHELPNKLKRRCPDVTLNFSPTDMIFSPPLKPIQ